jgi:hypothetical protein
MARNSKVTNGLGNKKIAKPTPEQLTEWGTILDKEGLRMGRGTRNWLTFVGSARDVEYIEGANRTNKGKVKTDNESER